MAYGILLFLAFLTVFCFPSANLQLFDGLPISRIWEFAALAAVIPFLLFSNLRNRQADYWKKWGVRPVFLWLGLGAVLAVKIVLFASEAQVGFSGCYRSPAEPTEISHEDLPPAECERSYENLFGRYPGTRMDETIRFGPDVWNLVFVNTSRYNYYQWETGNLVRSRMPLEIRWKGRPDVSEGESIRIEYTGQGTVVWGNVRADLPHAYAALHTVTIGPPSAESPLQIDYYYDDESRSGQDSASWGPGATIRVMAVSSDGTRPLSAESPGWGYRGLALLADALLLVWMFSCLPALWHSVRRDLPFLIAFCAALGLFVVLPAAPWVRSLGMTAVMTAVLVVHICLRPLRWTTLYFLAVAAALAIMRIWATSGFGMVMLRSAGNDALSYESQAYSILATGSLRGGESVFFYIPAYRYIKYLEHALFGDGDMLYAAAQLAAFFGGVFVLFRGLDRRKVSSGIRILLSVLGAAMVFLGGYYVSSFIHEGLSEYPTWIILLWALAGLMGAASPAVLLFGTAALAVAYTVRPNQATGIAWIMLLTAAQSWKKHLRWLLLAGLLALGIALLPLLHNICFGGEWEPMATSGAMSLNLVLTPTTWLAYFRGDPAAVETVREQMGMLFLITEAPRSMWPTLAVLAVCLLGWLVTCGRAIARRSAKDLAWLAVPLCFLAIHLVYGISTYYPRHVVVGYLSMAAVSTVVLIRELPAREVAVRPAVKSRHA
jgi:hypothetical protein